LPAGFLFKKISYFYRRVQFIIFSITRYDDELSKN
jgi:hypothetical protein